MPFFARGVVVRLQYRFTLVLFSLSLVSLFCAQGQSPVIVGGADQLGPLPGGHAYIEGLNETVTPANGQLSIRIDVPTAKGRQLNIPFSFAYNSNGLWSISPLWGITDYHYSGAQDAGNSLHPAAYGVSHFIYAFGGDPSTLSLDGWGYTLPYYSVAVHNASQDITSTHTQCSWLSDFQFYDQTGSAHPLRLGYFEPGNSSLQTTCNQSLNAQIQNYTTGGDNYVRAAFTGQYSTTPVVTDLDGRTYTFTAATPSIESISAATATGLASMIEDRNGNQVKLTQNGPAYAYVDTMGRTALSISGLGTPTDSIQSTLFSQPYKVAWETISMGNPMPTIRITPSNATSGGPCQPGMYPSGGPTTWQAVQSITLPNGDAYTFSYDPSYGLLSRITYPTGAYVNYTWGINPQSEQIQYASFYAANGSNSPIAPGSLPCASYYDVPAIIERDVSYDGNQIALKQTFSYNTVWAPAVSSGPQSGWTSKTTTKSEQDFIAGTTETTYYTYTPTPALLDPNTSIYLLRAPNVPVESSVQYGNLMSKTEYWQSADKKLCEVDTYNGISKGVFTDYQQYGTNPNTFYGAPDEQRLYDFGSVVPADCSTGPYGNALGSRWPQANPLTRTVTTYLDLSPVLQYPFVQPQSPTTPLFLTAPQTSTTTGSGGNQSATSFIYDATPVIYETPLPSHDEAKYGLNSTISRGNVTSVIKSIDSTTNISSQYTYDESGNIISSTDPNNNTPTQFAYTPQSAYAYIGQITRPPTGGVSHITTYQHDNVTGKVTETVDENSQVTDYQYNDPLGRITSLQGPPINGQRPLTQYLYVDGASPSSTITSPTGTVRQTIYDGFGRSITSITQNDPQGPIYSFVKYDGKGNTYQQWNPTRCNLQFSTACPAETTYGKTTYTHDQLGRSTTVVNPDGTSSSTTYNGNIKSRTDENGNVWQYVSDAANQMTSVLEPNSLSTIYAYDALGNLKSANQPGNSANGDTPRLRNFTYDSLSRLLISSNPESGILCYGVWQGGACVGGYDPNGNLRQKSDARGAVTTYNYDALNRLVSKSYAAPGLAPTPPVTFVYDVSTNGPVANSIGRLVSEYTGPSTAPITQHSILAYDALGRATNETQCITVDGCSQTPYALQYMYDLEGRTTYASNGAANNGIGLTYQYDPLGRLQSVTSTWDDPTHPATLLSVSSSATANSQAYDPMGHLTSAQLAMGSGQSSGEMLLNRQYDNRGRIKFEQDSANRSFGTITIQGMEQSVTRDGSTHASLSVNIPTVPYGCNGNALVYVNNSLFATVPFGWYYGPQSSSNAVASAIASALNTPSSLVTGQLAGTTTGYYGPLTILQLTSNSPGSVGNYNFSVNLLSSSTNSPNGYSPNGYSCGTVSGTLSGGVDSSVLSYDTGTISIGQQDPGNIFGSTTWGQGDTVQSVLSSLATSLQMRQGVTASVSGNSIIISTDPLSQSGGLPLYVNIFDTANMSIPSFSAAVSGMSPSTGAPLPLYAYSIPANGYDPVGNVLSFNDSQVGSWNYTYDNLNRLVSGTAGAGSYLGLDITGAALTWSYDSFGNRLAQASNNALLPSGSVQFASGNNQATGIGISANQAVSATSFQYDASGNQTAQNGNPTSLFDADGRLCATTNANGGYTQYLYDAEGRRVAKGLSASLTCDLTTTNFIATFQYILGQGGEQITELDGQGSWLHSNVYAADMLLATYDPSGLHFHFADWLGTQRVQVSAGGIVESTCQSFPFGDGQSCSGSDVTEHHYTGQVRDAESNLDYFGARYYGSSTGRFTSPDWSEVPSAIPYATLSDPQSLNLYRYAANNPLRFRDRDGHTHQECQHYNTTSSDADGTLHQVVNEHCVDVPDWWNFQGARSWLGRHPKTVKTVGGLVMAATAFSGVFDGGASELALPEELVVEEGLLTAGEEGAEVAIDLSTKPVAENPELQKIIDELYKSGDSVPGGTAGAARQELATGENVGGAGKGHFIKAIERAKQLQNGLARGRFKGNDARLARAIMNDLRSAVTRQ